MLGVVEVLGGVLVLGRVTTADLSTDEAHTQVDPGIAHLHALFTDMFLCFSYFDLVKMGAFFRHKFLLDWFGTCITSPEVVRLWSSDPCITVTEKGATLPQNDRTEVFHSCYGSIISLAC
jgi:hypothetical protein